jgi:hypothetical protein
MRARIIPTLLFLFSFSILSAQTSSANPVAFKFNGGIIGGATLSQIHGDGVGGFNKIGFNLGATVEMRNSAKKSLQLSVVYNQKGSRKPPNPSAGDWDTWAYRFTYIDLPVTLNYRYSSIDIIVGLQPSLLVAAEENFYGVGFGPTSIPVKKWDLCAVIGLRTQYGEHSLLVARLTQSIIPIAPVPPSDPLLWWDNRMMNMTLELGVVYLVGRI